MAWSWGINVSQCDRRTLHFNPGSTGGANAKGLTKPANVPGCQDILRTPESTASADIAPMLLSSICGIFFDIRKIPVAQAFLQGIVADSKGMTENLRGGQATCFKRTCTFFTAISGATPSTRAEFVCFHPKRPGTRSRRSR